MVCGVMFEIYMLFGDLSISLVSGKECMEGF